ncbi:hypothetical protein CAPN001_03790 [Capnocytophaga stomatis]|uniref:RteC domain-containing protein n=1 Tax=Capnocytophaga stomatis TaxID=1848904 RepID=UPI001951EBF4|nr:RteC domain-containing protein [Capnocytophaga stomatis]GIJ95810.1 hypothetical protein CAPN001_03790 [Capnocytophaga stomatis]GIM48805.1 hypothetical protein CAPN003_02570 [Capnocytophaga stomatis]
MEQRKLPLYNNLQDFKDNFKHNFLKSEHQNLLDFYTEYLNVYSQYMEEYLKKLERTSIYKQEHYAHQTLWAEISDEIWEHFDKKEVLVIFNCIEHIPEDNLLEWFQDTFDRELNDFEINLITRYYEIDILADKELRDRGAEHLEFIFKEIEPYENITSYIKNEIEKETDRCFILKLNNMGAIPQPENIKPLQWKGEAIELAELVQALIESKLLNPELTQKEIYSRFKAFFEIDFDHEDKKKKIKNRTNTLTPFLEKLMISVENFITGKD